MSNPSSAQFVESEVALDSESASVAHKRAERDSSISYSTISINSIKMWPQEVVRLAEQVTTQTIDFDWSSFVDKGQEPEPELTGLLASLESNESLGQGDGTMSSSEENQVAAELATAVATTDEELEDDDEERPRQRMLF